MYNGKKKIFFVQNLIEMNYSKMGVDIKLYRE